MTTEQFARALRVPIPTVKQWELPDTALDASTLSLLRAVARAPDAVLAALAD